MKSKSKAPDRIWVWWDDEYDVGVVSRHGDKRYIPDCAREYAPADRIEELEAKLATCEKYRDAYAEMGRIGTEALRDMDAKLAESEARSEVLETLIMDVAADLYDGVAAHKIDQRIMDVIKQLNEEEEEDQ